MIKIIVVTTEIYRRHDTDDNKENQIYVMMLRTLFIIYASRRL